MITRCEHCGATMTANSQLGSQIECVKCRRLIAVTPSFDDIPDLRKLPKVVKSQVIREVVEVEIETVPFWLMLFQGVQIACLLAVIVYMWIPTSDSEFRAFRAEQARRALAEKEQREAIRYPSMHGYELSKAREREGMRDPFMQKYERWEKENAEQR